MQFPCTLRSLSHLVKSLHKMVCCFHCYLFITSSIHFVSRTYNRQKDAARHLSSLSACRPLEHSECPFACHRGLCLLLSDLRSNCHPRPRINNVKFTMSSSRLNRDLLQDHTPHPTPGGTAPSVGWPNSLQAAQWREFKWDNGKVVFVRKDMRAGVHYEIWRWKSGELYVTGCNAVVVDVLWVEQNATSVKCFISEHCHCRHVVYRGSGRGQKRGSAGYDQRRREVYLCAKPHFSKEWWSLMMVKKNERTHTLCLCFEQFCLCIFLCRFEYQAMIHFLEIYCIYFQGVSFILTNNKNTPSLYYVQEACPSDTVQEHTCTA